MTRIEPFIEDADRTAQQTASDEPLRRRGMLALIGAGAAALASCLPPSREDERTATSTQALSSPTALCCQSTADLRAITGSNAQLFAVVLGNAGPADGLGGMYAWIAGSTATDDGYLAVKPTAISGAGRWLRVSPSRVKTIAELKAITVESLPFTRADTGVTSNVTTVGCEVVFVEGYWTPQDGGGGTFIWDSTNATQANDDTVDGLVVLPNSAPSVGRWLRVRSGAGLWAEWWGLRTSASSSQFAAQNRVRLQRAVQAAASLGGPLNVGPGRFFLDGTITIRAVSGLHFIGAGAHQHNEKSGTAFHWAAINAAAGTPMFDLVDASLCYLGRFSINASAGTFALPVGIRSYKSSSAGTITAGSCTFDRIVVNGTNGGITKGFQLGGAGIDENNSEHRFEFCVALHFTHAGFSLEASQCKSNTFTHCQATYGDGPGPTYGVWSQATIRGDFGGSFHWFGGNIGYVDTCFHLRIVGDDTLIHGVDAEGCQRLLTTAGASASAALTVESVRFACNAIAPGRPHAIVEYYVPGPLTLRSCTVEGAAPGTQTFVAMYCATAGALIAMGNVFHSEHPAVFVATGGVRATVLGNIRRNAATGLNAAIPDRVATPAGTSRPAAPVVGEVFFDSVLGRPIWFAGARWVDATGATV